MYQTITDDKIYVCKFSNKRSVQAISYGEFKDRGANSVDPDEVVQIEPPHLDLRCSANVTIFISGIFRCMITPP